MLKTVEKALLLQEVDFLRFASADHLMQLAEAGREEIFRNGETIVKAGEASLVFFILLEGSAATRMTGEETIEKTAVNLCACLSGLAQNSSYFCLEDCTLLAIDTSDLLDLIAGEPEFSLALLKYFAARELGGS
jgi:CRP-like cAMP-binding protein